MLAPVLAHLRHAAESRLLLLRVGPTWPRGFCSAAAVEEQLYSTGAAPPYVSDAIVAASITGRGRGILARAPLSPGQLLMAVPPLTILHGPLDEPPDAGDLDARLSAACAAAGSGPAVAAAAAQLYDGTPSSAQRIPDLRLLAQAAEGGGRAGAGCARDDAAPASPAAAAAQVVRFNAFGDGFEDLAAARVRGAPPRSHVGVWAPFSLLNHSCGPNTVHYVVGATMVVRATEEVAAGEEVTVSYMGREEFAPAGTRQAALRERYGFDCRCRRCESEARTPPDLARLVAATHTTVRQELRPWLLAAAEAEDEGGVAAAAARLVALSSELDACLRRHAAAGGLPQAQSLQACVYDLYELQHLVLQLGAWPPSAQPPAAPTAGSASPAGGGVPGSDAGAPAPPDTARLSLALLGRCLGAVDAVCRGSELHQFLAAALMQAVLGGAAAVAEAPAAAAALVKVAHEARYGSTLPEALALALMEANHLEGQAFV